VTQFPLKLTFIEGTVELNFDEVIILDSDGVTNLNAGNPYGNTGDMSGFVFESSGDTIHYKLPQMVLLVVQMAYLFH